MYYQTVFILHVMFDQTVVTITIQRLCFVDVKTIYIITKYLCVIHVLLYKAVM